MRIPILSDIIEKALPGSIRQQTAPVPLDEDSHIRELKRQTTELKSEVKKLKRTVTKDKLVETNITGRARRFASAMSGEDAQMYMRVPPFYSIATYGDLYYIATVSPEISMVINKLRETVYKGGLEWQPDWTCMCPKCGEKYTGPEILDRCPKCDTPPDDVYAVLLQLLSQESMDEAAVMEILSQVGQTEDSPTGSRMVVPDKAEYAKVAAFFDACNTTDQSLLDVECVTLTDILTTDSWYYILRWDYKDIDEGGISHSKNLLEIFRGSPIYIRKVIDPYNRVGGVFWKCIFDGHVQKQMRWNGPYETESFTQPHCDKCGRLMHDVHYVQLAQELNSLDDMERNQFFIRGEVIDGHYYDRNTSYGMPPLVSIGPYAMTLMYQTMYMHDIFKERRVPQNAIWTRTNNPTSAEKRFERMLERCKQDPTTPYHFIIEAGDFNGDGEMGVIELMPKINEMSYIEAREELTNKIANWYGVIYEKSVKQATKTGARDIPTMSINPDTLECIQAFCDSQRKKLTTALGIRNWSLKNKPSDERGVMRKLQIEQLEWQNAQMSATLGFETLRTVDGSLVSRKPPITKDNIGMLTDLLMSYFQLKAQLEMDQAQFQSNPSYTPSNKTPDGTPTTKQDKLEKGCGGKRKYKDLKKALEGITVDAVALAEGVKVELEHKDTIAELLDAEPGEMTVEQGAELIARDHLHEDPLYYTKLKQLEKAHGSSMGRQAGIRMDTGGTKSGVSQGIGATGSQERPLNPQSATTQTPGTKEQYGKDGKSFNTKQALGGASRSRDKNQPQVTPEQGLLYMKLLIFKLLMELRASQMPMQVIGDQTKS